MNSKSIVVRYIHHLLSSHNHPGKKPKKLLSESHVDPLSLLATYLTVAKPDEEVEKSIIPTSWLVSWAMSKGALCCSLILTRF